MSAALEEHRLPAIRVSALPRDTNANGTIFGGWILSLIDQAGAIVCHRVGAKKVVTVAMREVIFRQPVQVGDVVTCWGEIVRVGRTSITVRVRVTAMQRERFDREIDVTTAEAVYVNVDESHRPIAVPPELASRTVGSVST
jgi:acyl-CoA thioesterase YciA